jgi:hypothetical protein
MDVSRLSSWICIKSNAAKIVKLVLFRGSIRIVLLSLEISILSPDLVFADEEKAKKPVSVESDAADYENLPEIEAKTYNLQVTRKSHSNKIYLFEDSTNRQPHVGRILLLKRDGEPIMAFRVLKNYTEKKLLAAKRIRRYKDVQSLNDGDSFLTIEKISDLAPPPPTAQDQADLKELEAKQGLKVSAYDEELDAGISPPAVPKEENQEDVESELDSHLAISIEEPRIFDHNNHWLTAGFGYIRNSGPPSSNNSPYYFSSGNVRYGLTVGKMVLLDLPYVQDSVVVEGGAYLYKTLNFASQGDAYTIASFSGTVRYNFLFSESFGVFVYTGVVVGRVISSSSADESVIASLSSTLPAAGAGLLFQVGPGWFTRIEAGLDAIGLNLLLRF